MSRIYLLGSNTGKWRGTVELRLGPSVDCVSPNRLEASVFGKKINPIMRKTDVARSDLVFINFLGVDRVEIETFIEIGWAASLQKPIIVVINEGNINNHPFLESLTLQVESLDLGIQAAKGILVK